MRTRAGLVLGVLASAAAVAAVSGVVELLEPRVPVLSLGALYVLAVLPVAIVWGTALATVVSVASMLAFNWLFLPPAHSFHLRESQNWLALAVYLVIAFAVSALAARARARREDAEQRRIEAHALAEAALDLLRGRRLDDELDRLATLTGAVLGVPEVRLVLGEEPPRPGERALTVEAGLRCVATLFVDREAAVARTSTWRPSARSPLPGPSRRTGSARSTCRVDEAIPGSARAGSTSQTASRCSRRSIRTAGGSTPCSSRSGGCRAARPTS